MKRSISILMFFGLLIMLAASTAFGMPILTAGSGDGTTWTAALDGRSAQAVFMETASGFDILLSNEAIGTSQNSEVLAGLFFGLNGGTAVATQVMVASGSILTLESKWGAGHGDNLSGEYGFLSGINGINGNLGDYGVSGTGFDPEPGAPAGWTGFGETSIINEAYSYKPPSSPNGAEFGIVNDPTAQMISKLGSFVDNSVLISFTYDRKFDMDSVTKVSFLYGTDYDVAVPEPSTIFLLGSSLIGLGFLSRKRFNE